MLLNTIILQNFRSYSKAVFTFSPQTTVIIGPNTSGKSNLLEAIFLLASGKSFKAEKDTQMIQFGKEYAKVKGRIKEDEDTLEVIITKSAREISARSYSKKFLVNGVAKRRVDFAGLLPSVLFVPSDLDIIMSFPSQRRQFLDAVLEMTDRQYRSSLLTYEKALRQRNALLHVVKETGIRNDEQFNYWDHLLIEHGTFITQKRQEFITYCNEAEKQLLSFVLSYDKSMISKERLEQYKEHEVGAGVTLVGPHRDDFTIRIHPKAHNLSASELEDVKFFGSRGQQRLAILQLKLLQLSYIEHLQGTRPLLLMDDIFSELDEKHIDDVLHIVTKQQTILTTTHEEFLRTTVGKGAEVIQLREIPL